MQIVILLAFVATLSTASMSMSAEPSWILAVLAGIYPAGAAVLSRLAGTLRVRAETQSLTATMSAWRSVPGALTPVWLVLGSVGLVELGYGVWVATELKAAGMDRWPLAAEIMLMTPFLLAVLLVWIEEYPAYLHMRRQLAPRQQCQAVAAKAAWTRREYIVYNLRHQLLFIMAPAGLILLARDLLDLLVPELLGAGPAADWTIAGGMLLAAGGVFLIAPVLIVHIWRTKAMPPGAMRDELEVICGRLRLRFRRLLVWQTGGMIANAGVMGLVARLRYVLLSDALLEQMESHHVQAVFAHEAGHIVSHHILYSAMFAVSTAMLAASCGDWLWFWTHWPDEVVSAIVFTGLIALWAIAFGYISRRFERQSDVIAAWVMGEARVEGVWPSRPAGGTPAESGAIEQPREGKMPSRRAGETPASQTPASQTPASLPIPAGRITPDGAAVFAMALQRVAELNGMSYNRRNWRHGSIAWRVQYILSLGSTEGNRSDIDRVVRRIKAICWLLLAAAMAATVVPSL